ncbi:hypothetical protein Srufu_052060 [Streptomyces libani subsp. rufus]|nr:hypothetical protein Srufu_052060 [Streptomyces libani subsp. rufus]
MPQQIRMGGCPMRQALRRIAATTGILVAAAAIPLVTAGPAQAANSLDCELYLLDKGYKVGPKASKACYMMNGSLLNKLANEPICATTLAAIGVKGTDAQRACTAAM